VEVVRSEQQGLSLWNKDGIRYFLKAEVKWKEIYNSEDNMKITYNGWEKWITTTGKRITVGDGTTKTFHAVMATWYEETPQSKKRNESEDEEGFGLEGGYSLERGCSRHSLAWRKGTLRDKTMGGEEQGDSYSEQYKERNGEDGEDYEGPPLFEVPSLGSSGAKHESVVDSPARNTRKRTNLTNMAKMARDKRKKGRGKN
jgi:hypothetical protein